MRRLLVALVLSLAAPTHLFACVLPPPQRVRQSDPFNGDTRIPTSVLPRVAYLTGPFAETECGDDPGAPLIRLATPDAGAGDDGGTGVAGEWVKATDGDPGNGVAWEFHPAAPLLPNTTYELVDGWPADCACYTEPCMGTPPAVFTRFTTGDGPDVTPPLFSGLVGAFCSHDVCTQLADDCCGPFNHLAMHFTPDLDSSDANLRGIRLYLRLDGGQWDFKHPVGGMVFADPVDAAVAPTWNIKLQPGTYHVIARAYDTSGNEDANMVEEIFTFPLAQDARCIIAEADAATGIPDMSYVDPYDFTGFGRDMMEPVDNSGGCTHCDVGTGRGRPGAVGGVALCAAFGLLIGGRARGRARRRSRRGAAAAAP